MPNKYPETALLLYKITADPLLLDAIRLLSDPKSPEMVVLSAENYVKTCYSSALILFRNSGKYTAYELTDTRFSD